MCFVHSVVFSVFHSDDIINMLKEKIKHYWKKEQFKALVITSVLAVIYLIIRWQPGVVRNISDFFCSIGLLHFVVGLSRYIHNVGLFKTFSYMAYKRRTRKTQGYDGTVIRPMSLAEYTEKYIYADIYQKDIQWPLLRGAAFIAVSLAIALLV